MLTLLREKSISIGTQFSPVHFVFDFEKAMHNAIKSVFGDTSQIKECLFHFTQAIFRKVQKLGLPAETPKVIVKLYRSLGALSMVPLNQLDDAWDLVQNMVLKEKISVIRLQLY